MNFLISTYSLQNLIHFYIHGHYSNSKQGWTSFILFVLVLFSFKSGCCRYGRVVRTIYYEYQIYRKNRELCVSDEIPCYLEEKNLEGRGKKGHSAGVG